MVGNGFFIIIIYIVFCMVIRQWFNRLEGFGRFQISGFELERVRCCDKKESIWGGVRIFRFVKEVLF